MVAVAIGAVIAAIGIFPAAGGVIAAASGPIATTTGLTADPSPAYLDDPVTLTVQVTPAPTDAGQAAIYDDIDSVADARYFISIAAGTGVGSATLPFGTFVYQVGTHGLRAQFLGTAGSAPSSSPVVEQVMRVDPSSTSLDVTPATVGPRGIVTFAATIDPAPATATQAKLHVEKGAFTGIEVWIPIDSSGRGSTDVDTTNWPTGAYAATAEFWGTVRLAPSISASETLVITAPDDPPPPLADATELDAWGGPSCALDTVGMLSCWGKGIGPSVVLPAGPFRSISYPCGVLSTGRVVCWGPPASPALQTPPDGTFLEVNSAGPVFCGLRIDHTLACWGDPWYLPHEGNAPFGEFEAVSGTCALRSDHTVSCWGPLGGVLGPPAGQYKQVSSGGGFGCAIRLSDETLVCWGGNFFGESSPPVGAFVTLSAGGHHACAIDSHGDLRCWGDTVDGPPAFQPGPFTQVASGPAHVCARRDDGTVACWGNTFEPWVHVEGAIASEPPPGATLDSAYSHIFVANEVPVPSFHVVAGALPPGLALSSDGMLTGTPIETGTWPGITVQGSNGIAPVVRQTFDLTVSVPPISVDGGAAWTNTPAVPVDVSGLTANEVRVSNNGTTWEERSYTPTVAWSLTDTLHGGTGADGMKSVFVQWRRDGAWTESAVDSIGLDRVAPIVGAPRSRVVVGSTAGTSTIPIQFAWTGSDARAGILRYEIGLSTDGHEYMALAPQTATSLTRGLRAGHTYRLRVRALDRAGNRSAYSYGASLRLTIDQETSRSLAYRGNWHGSWSSDYFGGKAEYSTVAASSVTTKFTGRQFSWLSAIGPTRGSARVYVDGHYVKTVNLYSASRHVRRVVLSLTWASTGTHTVQIRVVGTSGHPRVDVDAFIHY